MPSYVKTQSPEDITNRKSIKLFHSNVLTSNTQYLELINQVYREEPDVVILQDIDKSWIKNLTLIIMVRIIRKLKQYQLELGN